MFPREKENALHVIYRFCHLVDDAVDEHGSEEDKKKRLDEIHRQLVNVGEGEPWEALEWIRNRYEIPIYYFEDLIQGARSDIGEVRMNNYSELRTYCYQVAGTVGLMTLRIMGFHDRSAYSFSRSMARAFQLTNILRDVEEDRRMGRRYVPESILRGRGGMDDWRKQRYTSSVREALRDLGRRARLNYRQSLPLFTKVDRDSRFPLALMNSAYSWYLHRLEQIDFDPTQETSSLPYWILPRLFWRSWRGSRNRPELCLMIS